MASKKATRTFLVSYNFVDHRGSGFGDTEIIMADGKLNWGSVKNIREVIETRLHTDRVVILNIVELES